MIGHVVIGITEAPVIGWMATRWLWSGCEDGEGAHLSWTVCSDIFLLCCSSAAEKLRNPQFALQRVSVFHPISLCNALFIAFLCNYSVIRLSSVQQSEHCVSLCSASHWRSLQCSHLCVYKQRFSKMLSL